MLGVTTRPITSERFPKVLMEGLTDMRRRLSRDHGNHLLICMSLIKLVTPHYASPKAYKASFVAFERRFASELVMFCGNHGVILSSKVLEKGEAQFVFDNQEQGRVFYEEFPLEFGGVQLYRDGGLIGERQVCPIDIRFITPYSESTHGTNNIVKNGQSEGKLSQAGGKGTQQTNGGGKKGSGDRDRIPEPDDD